MSFKWGKQNRFTEYSRWFHWLTILFWPLAIVEAITWFVGDQWWTMILAIICGGYVAIYGISFFVETIYRLYRHAHE
ncbi:hypothetical protein [Lactiplantibacillus daowaiensis]|uniref:Uncharacterized protein n=1 Tax=Lactiplantibacillus daowaiensis TaxID=2559918 RepID=A0ABW1S2B6_9LACO